MFDFVTTPGGDTHYRQVGEAHVHLAKAAGTPVRTDALSGRLYFSRSGWLLLSVPNALGQGAFDALDEAGVELPKSEGTGRYNAHITVLRPEEVAKVGGPDKITERGHSYRYSLGAVKAVEPNSWGGTSKVWYITVESPDLKELRRSYGLTPLPHNNEHDFHITFGVRKTGVLQTNAVSKGRAKAAEDMSEPYLALDHEEADAPTEPDPVADAEPAEVDAGPHCGGVAAYVTGVGCGKGTAKVKAAREEKRGPAGEYCPHCDARLERDPYSGKCNSCGKAWPEKAAAKLIETMADLYKWDSELRAKKAKKSEKAAGALVALVKAGLAPAKRKRKPKAPPPSLTRQLAAGGLPALLGAGAGAGVVAKGNMAEKVPYGVVRLPLENQAREVRGLIHPGAAPAEIMGVGPYVRTANREFAGNLGMMNAHHHFDGLDDAARGVKDTLAKTTDPRPARVEMTAHGAPGLMDFGGGALGVSSRDEEAFLRKLHNDRSGRWLNQSTAREFGKSLGDANLSCVELGSCNVGNDKPGIVPGRGQTGSEMAAGMGKPVLDYGGYGYGNPDMMAVEKSFPRAEAYRDTPLTQAGGDRVVVTHAPDGGTTRTQDRQLDGGFSDNVVRKSYAQPAPVGGTIPQKIYQGLYNMGPVAAIGGAALAPTLNKKWGRRAMLAGTLGTLPMLLSEGLMSHGLGKAKMELQGGGVADYLGQYGRMAPYAALAALPAASWGLAKALGRWKGDRSDDPDPKAVANAKAKAKADEAAVPYAQTRRAYLQAQLEAQRGRR